VLATGGGGRKKEKEGEVAGHVVWFDASGIRCLLRQFKRSRKQRGREVGLRKNEEINNSPHTLHIRQREKGGGEGLGGKEGGKVGRGRRGGCGLLQYGRTLGQGVSVTGCQWEWGGCRKKREHL